MKPERLEMVGFAPFRARVEVDFSGLELFALTGPTGAGKSSVIDAITFALYGVVARYDDKRSVEPIISLGAAEARLRFDFEVAGSSYTAVRLVRRTANGGATTAEARLECNNEVLASGAAEVTKAVESLLGLNIDHFTRSVVLPQGEFAAFLHDTPSGQQDLVKALLDMGALDGVRRLATERSKMAAALASSARDRLDHLGDATEEAEEKAEHDLGHLESLTTVVAEREQAIGTAQVAVATQKEKLQALQDTLRILDATEVPSGVAELSDALTVARQRVTTASAALQAATEESDKLAAISDELPSLERLAATEALYERFEASRKEREQLDLARLESVFRSASARAAKAADELKEADAAWEAARARHAAHDLSAGLHAGDPCPVCAQPLLEDPPEVPPDLEQSRASLAAAKVMVQEAAEAVRVAESEMAAATATDAALARVIADLQSQLTEQPSPTEVARLKKARQELDAKVALAAKKVASCRREETDAKDELAKLSETAERARGQLGASRDALAAIGQPPTATDDIAGSWRELVGWCRQESERIRALSTEASERLDQDRRHIEELQEATEQLLSSAGVTGSGTPTARLSGAVATMAAGLDRIRERRKERLNLESDLGRFEERSDVARSLANHLRADRFMGWLMAEALATLVGGANSLLDELSQGAYSLVVSDRLMEIVDHRNAEERRSVRSLSGGETFLVSLALALSLGEQLTNLSGGTPLDAIFLDEGFGSLDAETLETVSTVVTELAARGRIVGLVTHVKELAEQVPVRFEVHPGPGGSTIERVAR